MDNKEKQKDKALIVFGSVLIKKMDKHWRDSGYRSRSEYVNYLVRKDMDQNGQIQPAPLERTQTSNDA